MLWHPMSRQCRRNSWHENHHYHHYFDAPSARQYSDACQPVDAPTNQHNSYEGGKNDYSVWHVIDSLVLGLESYRLRVTMATFGPRLRNENQLRGNLARFKKFCLKINISDFGRSAKICRQKIHSFLSEPGR